MIRELVQQALDFCVEKNPHLTDKEGLVSLLLREDSWAHSVFRYALAMRICEYLSIHHQELEEIYLTGSTLDNRARFTSDIDLIIKTNESSEAVIDTLRRLDNDILIYYRSLLGQPVKRMYQILDSEIVSFQKEGLKEVKGRLFAPPLLVWHRSFSSN